MRFRALAAGGSVEEGLRCLHKLDARVAVSTVDAPTCPGPLYSARHGLRAQKTYRLIENMYSPAADIASSSSVHAAPSDSASAAPASSRRTNAASCPMSLAPGEEWLARAVRCRLVEWFDPNPPAPSS